jgi:phosphate transport system permease protein
VFNRRSPNAGLFDKATHLGSARFIHLKTPEAAVTTALPVHDAAETLDSPRRLASGATGSDRVFVLGSRAVGATVLAITGGIGFFLAVQSVPTLEHYGFSFFTETQWQPEADVLGIAAVLVGTLSVALVALSVSFPLSVLTALYISEYAPQRLKATFTSAIDLMAAVPSIIYGLWGFFLLQPHASEVALWLHRNLGWIPLFKVGADPDSAVWDQSRYTASAFVAGLAVAMMVMPMACAVMRQVFAQAPQGEREAALALGSTRWGMIRTVVLPYGRGAIIGGTMLGLGRALGETIAVLLIISPAFELKPRILEIGTNTVSALIAGRFGEASTSQLAALLTAGFVLFMITLLINTAAAVFVTRSRSGQGAEA